jgi:hypothetical protein
MRRFDPLPYGLALLALGLDIAALAFLSLSELDVTIARARSAALGSMVIVTPALILYALRRDPPGDWWRAFWTAGMLAYLAHFWWVVFVTYDGDFKAIVERQGFIAYTNFLVTFVWPIDVVLAWIRNPLSGGPFVVFRFLVWALVAVSFIAASAVFRSGSARTLGLALTAALIFAIAVRYFVSAPERSS